MMYDEFVKRQGPVYLETVKGTRETLLALTEAFTSLANGTMENAHVFLNGQGDVLGSIKRQRNQSGLRG
jgi:hypothetical protein